MSTCLLVLVEMSSSTPVKSRYHRRPLQIQVTVLPQPPFWSCFFSDTKTVSRAQFGQWVLPMLPRKSSLGVLKGALNVDTGCHYLGFACLSVPALLVLLLRKPKMLTEAESTRLTQRINRQVRPVPTHLRYLTPFLFYEIDPAQPCGM